MFESFLDGPVARVQSTAAIAAPSRPDLKMTQDFTASIWVKPTRRVNDWARVFGKGSRHNRNLGLWIHPDGRVLSQVYGPSSPNVWNVKGATAPLGQWTHIAATFSRTISMRCTSTAPRSAASPRRAPR